MFMNFVLFVLLHNIMKFFLEILKNMYFIYYISLNIYVISIIHVILMVVMEFLVILQDQNFIEYFFIIYQRQTHHIIDRNFVIEANVLSYRETRNQNRNRYEEEKKEEENALNNISEEDFPTLAGSIPPSSSSRSIIPGLAFPELPRRRNNSFNFTPNIKNRVFVFIYSQHGNHIKIKKINHHHLHLVIIYFLMIINKSIHQKKLQHLLQKNFLLLQKQLKKIQKIQ